MRLQSLEKDHLGDVRSAAAENRLEEYEAVVERLRPPGLVHPGNMRFHCQFLFDGVVLEGKTVLDVGAGDGRYSFYAACGGATRVVALEPDLAGSGTGVQERFSSTASAFGLEQAELVTQRLQDYDSNGETFDVVLLSSSINHLDEEACIRLRYDGDSQETYRALFHKLAALTRAKGTLIVTDCSSENLFAHLGIRNPISPSIEWHKHQKPELWAALLGSAGFTHPRLRWASFNTLREPGRLVLGNRLASWFLKSSFCLTMERADG